MARYIDIEPYEATGDSHEVSYRDHCNIIHIPTDEIPSENVVGKEILDMNFGGKITGYFCQHCGKFKRWWQIEKKENIM